MATLQAKNLLTFVFQLPESPEVLVLGYSTKRTFLGLNEIQTAEAVRNTDTRFWLGPLLPPFDVNSWPVLTDVQFRADDGVAGPIYISEVSSRLSNLVIISAIDEEALAEIDPNAGFFRREETCALADMVDDSGNLLITDTGDQLIACI